MEIAELLKTDEAKAAIQAAVEEATSGLKAKNEELLGNLKKEKDNKSALEQKLEAEAEAKRQAEEEAALKSGDSEKIAKTYEEKMKKIESEYQAKIADKDSKLHSLLVDNGLTDALSKAGVAPQYMDAAKALIQSRHKPEITDVDGQTVAQFDGKPLTDFVSEWTQGDQGKHFKAAPDNGGGGANGSNTGGKASGAKGDMGGDRSQRAAAIASKYPELQSNSK